MDGNWVLGFDTRGDGAFEVADPFSESSEPSLAVFLGSGIETLNKRPIFDNAFLGFASPMV